MSTKPRKKHNRGKLLSQDRIATIQNHISEEYMDLGQTSFATKAELCEVILDSRRTTQALRTELELRAGDLLKLFLEHKFPVSRKAP